MKDKIEDICYKLSADYCGDTEWTTDQAVEALLALFKSELKQALVGNDLTRLNKLLDNNIE